MALGLLVVIEWKGFCGSFWVKLFRLLVLAIQLPGNTYLECLFEASAKDEIDQLLDLFRMLTPIYS